MRTAEDAKKQHALQEEGRLLDKLLDKTLIFCDTNQRSIQGGAVVKEKTVTLADIARELGVSKNAVSLALRGKDGVSDAMRERIIAKAREMQYHGLNKTQGVILALIPQRLASSESMFYHQLCFDMEAHASALGYQLIISSVSAIDESLCRPPVLLDTVNCMGIITVGNLSRAIAI